MTRAKRRIGVLAGLGVAVFGLLGWAWIDGGAEPLRPMSQPVALPGSVR